MKKLLLLVLLFCTIYSCKAILVPKKCTCEYDVISIKTGQVIETIFSTYCSGSYSNSDIFREATLYYKMKNLACE
jgi:hypothetical protein